MDKEKLKAIDLAVGAIEKQFGKGSIMRLGNDGVKADIDIVPTGALSLDIALGVGGLPKGRIIEIFGPESSGKTTMTLHSIAESQRLGGVCAFVDAEHALDTGYARKIGVDLDNLLISQPDTGEQALEIVEMLVRSGAVDLVVVDSVAALTPKAELEGDMGDRHVGLQARLMSQALRKLAGIVSRTNCVVIFINQLRMKIGVMFGSPETTTGGNALKFYSSIRLDIRRIASVKVGEETVGNRVRIKVVKNKMAAPFKQAEFDIMFDQGVSRIGDIIDLAVAKDIIRKSGSWFSYGDERLGQGREGAKTFIQDNKELCHRLEDEIRVAYGLTARRKEESTSTSSRQGASAAAAAAASAAAASVSDDDAALEKPEPTAKSGKGRKAASAAKS